MNELRVNTAVTIFGKWAEKQFPESTSRGVLAHMQEELLELIDLEVSPEDGTASENADEMGEEAADVFLLLCHYCFKRNINLQAVAEAKFEINQGREWDSEPNEDGYYKHKEEK